MRLAPGIGPYLYPENVGFYVQEDADLAFENHYHLSGKATTDQSYIGIYFAEKAPEKYITGSIMGTQKLQIPAGTANYTQTVWTYVPTDIELLDLTPHMHYIGKEVKVDVLLPNGKKEPILHVTDWDLRWQSVYTLRELKKIPKGSMITATFIYDNSDDNHDNPHYPAKEMYWGWASEDEMCEVYFSYVPANTNDYGKMLKASLTSFEHSYPYSQRTTISKQNIDQVAQKFAQTDLWSEEGQAMLYSIIESCFAQQVATAMSKYKSMPNASINRLQLLFSDAYLSMDATQIIEQSEKLAMTLYTELQKNPTNWNASYSYGILLLQSDREKDSKEGLKVLTQLI